MPNMLDTLNTEAEGPMAHATDLNPAYTHVPRLEAGSAEANAFLEENGFVVVRAVLSPDEVAQAKTLTWDYLEQLGARVRM